MTIGAVSGFIVAFLTNNLWLGMLAGTFFGVMWSLIMAWLSVTMRANQVIAGIGLNILGGGVAVYVYRVVFGIQSLPPQVSTRLQQLKYRYLVIFLSSDRFCSSIISLFIWRLLWWQ